HLRAGGAELVEVQHHGATANDGHPLRVLEGVAVDLDLRGRKFDLHPTPVGVHLVGEDQRQRGHRALAHLGAGREDGDRAIRGNADPGVDLLRRCCVCGRDELEAIARDRDGEGEGARGLQERSAVHGYASFDARSMAAMMRWYVPQRQMLPSMCWT